MCITKWKKTIKKKNTLYDSNNVMSWKRQNEDSKKISGG